MGKNDRMSTVYVLPHENEKPKTDEPADFETAIAATGFGKFNIFLILVAVPAASSSMFETSTMSYVFPAAQCDLDLSLEDKGILNAVTYIGMITSGLIWGYLCDTLGRKKLLVLGYGLDGLFTLMGGFSQNFTFLLVMKFFGGFIINGPFAMLTSYLSEFHSAKYRAIVLMVVGVINTIAIIILPVFAMGVLPLEFDVTLFNGYINLHSWNLLIMICSSSALTACFFFIFMPESPKFLMTTGNNEKALAIFQKVYAMNTGKPAETFPIANLVNEIELNIGNSKTGTSKVTANRSKKQALKEGFSQITPIFFPPHLLKISLVCTLQMCCMLGLNTLRLWMPQLLQAINDYQLYNNGSRADLCTMIEVIKPPTNTSIIQECVVNTNPLVYQNAFLVGVVNIPIYLVASVLINKAGKKFLLISLSTIGGLAVMGLYWSMDNITTIALVAIFIAVGSVASNVTLTVVVDLFPTTLRTVAICLTMMFGRGGPTIGNLVFPLLLQIGCVYTFFTLAAIFFVVAVLAILLPNTDRKALE